MKFEARCRTTAMGIMPHRDIDKALELALALDIPFWPQLPRVNLFEDMYVQASEGFPGIYVDTATGKITVDTARFIEELAAYSEKLTDPTAFRLTSLPSLHGGVARGICGYTWTANWAGKLRVQGC